jgi:hypothetical protein
MNKRPFAANPQIKQDLSNNSDSTYKSHSTSHPAAAWISPQFMYLRTTLPDSLLQIYLSRNTLIMSGQQRNNTGWNPYYPAGTYNPTLLGTLAVWASAAAASRSIRKYTQP